MVLAELVLVLTLVALSTAAAIYFLRAERI